MLSVLTDTIRRLAGAALFTGLILLLMPERKTKNALRFLCGVLISVVLLTAIGQFNSDSIAEELAFQKLRAVRNLTQQEENAWEVYRTIIKSETEAYIWKQAQELGIERLGVRLTLRDGETAPYPWAIALTGDVNGAQQAALSALLEGELGIPEERQQWSVTDDD